MPLGRLRLRNFQAHDKLTVELSPSVTCFVGASDRGKSSVIRALHLLCFNRPQGTEFVRHGREKAEVELEIDGRTVKRVRGEGVNLYELDGEKFQAFGSDVPDEIKALLRLDTVNFQRQMDGPFWLSAPAPDVARELNRIVDLSLIDEALANAAQQVKRAKTEAEVTARALHIAEERAKETEFTGAFCDAVAEVEALQAELDALKAQKRGLSDALARINELEGAARSGAPDYSPCDELASELRELVSRREALWRTRKQILFLEEEARSSENAARRAEAELVSLPNICPACKRPLTR